MHHLHERLPQLADDLRRLAEFPLLRVELGARRRLVRRQRALHRVVRVALGRELVGRAVEVRLQRRGLVPLRGDHLQEGVHRVVHLLLRARRGRRVAGGGGVPSLSPSPAPSPSPGGGALRPRTPPRDGLLELRLEPLLIPRGRLGSHLRLREGVLTLPELRLQRGLEFELRVWIPDAEVRHLRLRLRVAVRRGEARGFVRAALQGALRRARGLDDVRHAHPRLRRRPPGLAASLVGASLVGMVMISGRASGRVLGRGAGPRGGAGARVRRRPSRVFAHFERRGVREVARGVAIARALARRARARGAGRLAVVRDGMRRVRAGDPAGGGATRAARAPAVRAPGVARAPARLREPVQTVRAREDARVPAVRRGRARRTPRVERGRRGGRGVVARVRPVRARPARARADADRGGGPGPDGRPYIPGDALRSAPRRGGGGAMWTSRIPTIQQSHNGRSRNADYVVSQVPRQAAGAPRALEHTAGDRDGSPPGSGS